MAKDGEARIVSSRMQADDFLNAHHILKDTVAMGPGVVCLAFAVELYIKDVYFALKLKPPRSHKILKLYDDLPEDIKQKIFAHSSLQQVPWSTLTSLVIPQEPQSDYDIFIRELGAISDGFEKWRYAYEAGNLNYQSWFAEAFIEAVRAVAQDMCDGQ